MKKLETILFSVLYVIFLAVCVYGVTILIGEAARVVAAVIGVAGTLLGGLVKYGFDLDKQRRHIELVEKKKRENQRYLDKRNNYAELLSKVGDVVRKKEGADDVLTSIHLASWAFGSLDVVLATNEFQVDPSRENLMQLVKVIREELVSAEQSTLFDDEKKELTTVNLSSYDESPIFAAKTTGY
ncbi:MAG: hypothetical protein AB2692_04135 [Candidatus Thiodiazotropha sp.]